MFSTLCKLQCRGSLATRWRYTVAAEESLQQITVPQRLVKYHQKKELKNAKKQSVPNYKTKTIISCRRPEYNHRIGQRYSKLTPECLASHGWKHSKSKGDFFTINSFSENPAVSKTQSHNFRQLGIERRLIQGLEDMGITKATHIQELAVPVLLAGHSAACTAETGSGKTLAYMLPLLQRLLAIKRHVKGQRNERVPLSVMLVPSIELVEQTEKVARAVARHADVKIGVAHGSKDSDRVVKSDRKLDLLISTPASFLRSTPKGPVGSVQQVVLDEGDTLLDDSFAASVTAVLNKVPVQPGVPERGQVVGEGAQLVIVGATLPRSLHVALQDFTEPSLLEYISTGDQHRLLPHVSHTFHRVHADNRPERLLSLLGEGGGGPTIVFCNKMPAVNWLAAYLEGQGVAAIRLHGRLPLEARREALARFARGEGVLVATDIASRGLDTPHVFRVINFEFPHHMSDYIHRAGRVGRVSSLGSAKVDSLVSYKWDVELLWQLETASRLPHAELRHVNANIKRHLQQLAEAREQDDDPDAYRE